MVCLGLKSVAGGLKAQTNPLSYGGTPIVCLCKTKKEAGDGTLKSVGPHQVFS